MASRADQALVAGASFAVMLAAVGCFHGCDGASDVAGAGDGARAGEDAPANVIPEQDAGDAASEEDACARVLEPSADCKHPAVTPSCANGWCRIPRGCFIMGSPPCEYGRGLYSEDQIQVTLTRDFEMMQTEMTQAAWIALGYPNPSAQLDGGGGASRRTALVSMPRAQSGTSL